MASFNELLFKHLENHVLIINILCYNFRLKDVGFILRLNVVLVSVMVTVLATRSQGSRVQTRP
jgi:hypothetical protein